MAEKKTSLRELEHTADLGIELEAPDLPSLFSSAVEAIFGLIADLDTINPTEEIVVAVTGEGWENLFHTWLCELLAQFNLKGFVGKQCELKRIEPGLVEGRIRGETLDLQRHRFHTEIKGVTYHRFKVWQKKNVWHARVIFDV